MKSGIWGVVCLLLVAGGLYFAWTNLGQGVVEVNQQLTRKQAEVNTKRQAVDSYRNFASQLSAAQETLLKFEIASPEKPPPGSSEERPEMPKREDVYREPIE